MRKRKILVLCLVLLAVAAAAALLLRPNPEKLRQEVLAYIEAQTGSLDFPDVWEVWDEGRMLERYMSDWDADYNDLKGSISRAEELRRVFSVPELEGPVFRFGERMVGGGGKIYYLYPDSKRAVEISLNENDGYWLDLFAMGRDNTDTAAKAYIREKMRERVLKKFNPGDSDECSADDYRIEIKTQEGLELLLRCIENADVENMSGVVRGNAGPPYVYVGSMWLGGDSRCGYMDPGTWRSADLYYSNDDSEALREYINAAFDAQTQ